MPFPRSASPVCPDASCRSPISPSPPSPRSPLPASLTAAGRRAALATAALLVLVAADLLVFPLGSSSADQENDAYAALRSEPDGRLLELPLFEPGIHYGSVYDYYQLQAPRERPGGYSTLVPREAFDFYFLRNRLSCGVWLPGRRGDARGRSTSGT